MFSASKMIFSTLHCPCSLHNIRPAYGSSLCELLWQNIPNFQNDSPVGMFSHNNNNNNNNILNSPMFIVLRRYRTQCRDGRMQHLRGVRQIFKCNAKPAENIFLSLKQSALVIMLYNDLDYYYRQTAYEQLSQQMFTHIQWDDPIQLCLFKHCCKNRLLSIDGSIICCNAMSSPVTVCSGASGAYTCFIYYNSTGRHTARRLY